MPPCPRTMWHWAQSRLIARVDGPAAGGITAGEVGDRDGCADGCVGQERSPWEKQAILAYGRIGFLAFGPVDCPDREWLHGRAGPHGHREEERLALGFDGQGGVMRVVLGGRGRFSSLSVAEHGLLDRPGRVNLERHLSHGQAKERAQSEPSGAGEPVQTGLVRSRPPSNSPGCLEVQLRPPTRPARPVGRIVRSRPGRLDAGQVISDRRTVERL